MPLDSYISLGRSGLRVSPFCLRTMTFGEDWDGANTAAAALARVDGRPGVASTLTGARRLQQLKSNLDAIDVTLTSDQVDRLDAVSKPVLNFPADDNRDLAPNLAFAGATVDGVKTRTRPMLQQSTTRY